MLWTLPTPDSWVPINGGGKGDGYVTWRAADEGYGKGSVGWWEHHDAWVKTGFTVTSRRIGG